MHFDDRLATVLRLGTGGARAARTQFRQLVDLLGSAPADADSELIALAQARMTELEAKIPPADRAAILREPGLRLRNARLVEWLAARETTIAAAAMAAARLSPAEWDAIIPALPVPARALLRHRRDLSPATRDLLGRLGVSDLVLPEPEPVPELEPAEAALAERPATAESTALELKPEMEMVSPPADDEPEEARGGIGELVRRIEAFRRTRRSAGEGRRQADSPRLPLEETHEAPGSLPCFDFASDPTGRIDWADPVAAPMAVGLSLLSSAPDAPARAGEATLAAMRSHLPVFDGRLVVEGAPAIAGEWRVDAAPHFLEGGGFAGYRGRMRRPPRAPREAISARERQADLIRQLLHELRTPVNAIQGFAEVIQQQVLGPAPSEYRALAAAIAMDAARILGGFEELDRMAKLETGALSLVGGGSDLSHELVQAVHRLDGVLRPRSARIALAGTDQPCLVALDEDDLAQLAWRVLGTIAGALAPGEICDAFLRRQDGRAMVLIQLPATLEASDDPFAPGSGTAERRSVSAGMFGPAFALRLARAEATAAGGELERQGELLILSLPLLTDSGVAHSHGGK